MVSAGGATPENATQVVNATIHHTTDLLEGFTLLHVNESFNFDEKVSKHSSCIHPDVKLILYFSAANYIFLVAISYAPL